MTTLRLLAVLKLSETAPGVLARGDVMLHCMTNDPLFASSDPTAADFQADLEDLRSKQARRSTGPGAIEARNSALVLVKRDMERFRFFVQRLADDDPERAAEIITAAGMYVRKVPVPHKADLAIQQGPNSGTAIGIAKSRGRGATYWWEISGDQQTWVALPLPTTTATASFVNLLPGTLYYFRFRVLTRAGMSDWSQIVSFMVK